MAVCPPTCTSRVEPRVAAGIVVFRNRCTSSVVLLSCGESFGATWRSTPFPFGLSIGGYLFAAAIVLATLPIVGASGDVGHRGLRANRQRRLDRRADPDHARGNPMGRLAVVRLDPRRLNRQSAGGPAKEPIEAVPDGLANWMSELPNNTSRQTPPVQEAEFRARARFFASRMAGTSSWLVPTGAIPKTRVGRIT